MNLFVRTCSTERMNLARLFARIFLIVGAALWVVMLISSTTYAHATNFSYSFRDVMSTGLSALVPIIIAIAVFVLALFYERLAAIALFAVAAAIVVWGLIVTWEPGVWAGVLLIMVLPPVVAGVLLLLAAATQRVCELEGSARGGGAVGAH